MKGHAPQFRNRRGRPPPDPWPKFYTGCGRMVRVRDGVVVPCACPSCKQQS